MHKIRDILKQKAFLSVFATQFLGAFNDNLFRAALSGFVTYKLTELAPESKQIVVTLAVGLFMLPFFLFSALAGEIADKYRKDILFKVTKAAELVIALLAVAAFYLESPALLLGVLTLMGTQSAFFGPAKYSVLPDVLKENELIAGNALFEAGTYLAILQGVIIGGLIMSGEGSGRAATSVWIVSVAALGFWTSLQIPAIQAASPHLRIRPNFLKLTWENMKFAFIKREIFLCILGISWFWLVGAVLISQIPGFAQNVLNADGNTYTFLLTLFSCGIGIGAIACQSLLKGEISSRYLPFSAILMTLFLGDLAWATLNISTAEEMQTLGAFLRTFTGVRISFDLFMLALCGGVYMVPLNAMLQIFADEKIRSRVIATNNIVNALFMVAGSAVCVVLLGIGIGIGGIFAVMAAANAFVALYICGLLPEHLVRSFARQALNFLYRVDFKGVENFRNLKGPAVIIANHTSFIDALLLWVYLPSDVFFAVNTHVAREWWIRPFLHLVKYVPLDPVNPMGVKSIIEEVRRGRKVVIFPEGRITVTGSLMKVYPGPAVIADKSDADLLPVYIEGAQYSVFGRFSHHFRKRPKSTISVTILPPRRLETGDDVKGRERRLRAAQKLYDIMCDMKFVGTNIDKSLFESMMEARRLVGARKKVLEDAARRPLNYGRLMTGAFALGERFVERTREKEYVGLMLPNSAAAVLTFFGLQVYGRVPCMLNFSGGLKNILACCSAAEIKTVFTSREFIEKANLGTAEEALRVKGLNIVFLEDVKKEIRFADMARAWGKSLNPEKHAVRSDPNAPAVVLFTSGSEGLPKGVVLSHRNIQANRAQLSAVIDFGLLDSFFNTMPVFHSFGLTAGMLLPLLSGIKTFMYPSPLHYRIVPELIYDTNSTVIFGTDTFYNGYAKVAHPYDFHSVRFAVAGAEKVKEETFKKWYDTFGIRLLEGFGATETSPVLSLNLPMNFRRGTVGRLLPGIESRLDPVPGVEKGGRLFVKGPNIMLGYLKADNPGVLQPVEDGWYDTGDIVDIDAEGFIRILGRAKRFAKIAGEMISLSAVESELSKLWPHNEHAVVAVPDEKKGEQLVLFTTGKNADRNAIQAFFKTAGVSDLAVPRTVKIMEALPLMGTGKTDYVKLSELAAKL